MVDCARGTRKSLGLDEYQDLFLLPAFLADLTIILVSIFFRLVFTEQVLQSMKLYYNVQRLLERSADGTFLGPVSASARIFEFGEVFTTPKAGYDIPDEGSTRYIHLLFGIRHRDLQKIETIFVSLAYFAFLDLEKEWSNLVKDVQNGTLKEDLDITPEIRAQLLARLSPDPERAAELEREFKKGNLVYWGIFCISLQNEQFFQGLKISPSVSGRIFVLSKASHRDRSSITATLCDNSLQEVS